MRTQVKKLLAARPLVRRMVDGEVFSKTDALQCVVAYNRYGGYCVPVSSRHRPAAWKILSGDVYEPRTLEFMREHGKGAGIVHAGAYFGDFLPALASVANKVWAFEPNRENYRCARITLELNGSENVDLSHAGLGACRGSEHVMTTDAEGVALGGASRIADAGEEVEIVAVDDVVGDVSIIQLDVEGYEQQALAGALGTIRRCRPILILEELEGSGLFESAWFRSEILSLGYRMGERLHGNAVFRC